MPIRQIQMFLLLTTLFTTAVLNAQTNKNKAEDSILSFADKIIIKLNLDTRTDSYQLNENGEEILTILPNQNYSLSLSLDYEFIGASVGLGHNYFGANNDTDLKGESTFTDIAFRFFLGKWVQSVRYTKIKGYYVENTGDFLPNWTEGEDPYILFPTLQNTRYEASTAYVFNEEFSYRNLLYQNEWQRKSSGSFIPTARYNYQTYTLSNEFSMIDEWNLNFELLVPYYYTFVFNTHWFVAPSLRPGLGLKYIDNTTTSGTMETTETELLVTRILGGELQMGYSATRYIAGVRLNIRDSWYNEDKGSVVENDQLYGLIYFGYRFDTPKFISSLMEKLM